MIERLSKLEYDLKLLVDMTPFAAISYIRNSIGYQEYLEDYAVYRKIKVDELLEILDELMEISKEFESIDKWNVHIQKLKEDMENKKKKEEKNIPSVTMATFHGAKGLEFDNVFIIDANEGITPHNKSIKEEDIEEERRMFYVAMTRARKKLYIYYSKERYNKELTASRFIGEIFVDKDSIVAGAQIEHKIYGKGKIISIDSGRIKVKFDKIAMAKVLDVDFCISNRMISIYG
jgi:DNA helicase-2/ATP-dependent DNA helicase PcrA